MFVNKNQFMVSEFVDLSCLGKEKPEDRSTPANAA